MGRDPLLSDLLLRMARGRTQNKNATRIPRRDCILIMRGLGPGPGS